MGRLATLKPRIATASAPRIETVHVERKRGRPGMRDRERIRQRDKGLCQACLDRNLITLGEEVDHIVPLHKGGADSDANKRLLCRECHLEKTKADLQP